MSFVFMRYVKCIARVFIAKPNRTLLLFSKQYGECFVRFSNFSSVFCVNKFLCKDLIRHRAFLYISNVKTPLVNIETRYE